MADIRIVIELMRKHGVSKRLRRILAVVWSSIRNMVLWLFYTIKKRKHFMSAMLIAITAALILGRIPIAGKLLVTLCISIGAIMGLIEEFIQSVKAH